MDHFNQTNNWLLHDPRMIVNIEISIIRASVYDIFVVF